MAQLRMLCVALLVLGGCAHGPSLAEATPALPLGALSQLSFEFSDAENRSHYRITAPYTLVEREDGQIELEGRDELYRHPARVLVFAQDGALWALARVDGNEFLTRLR